MDTNRWFLFMYFCASSFLSFISRYFLGLGVRLLTLKLFEKLGRQQRLLSLASCYLVFCLQLLFSLLEFPLFSTSICAALVPSVIDCID